MPIRIELSPSFIICMCIGMTPPSKRNKDDESIKQAKPSKTYAGELWFMWLPGSQGLVDTHLPSVFWLSWLRAVPPIAKYMEFSVAHSASQKKLAVSNKENSAKIHRTSSSTAKFFRSPTPHRGPPRSGGSVAVVGRWKPQALLQRGKVGS